MILDGTAIVVTPLIAKMKNQVDLIRNNNKKESIKITLRFLSNEIRSDAITIKIFYKKCDKNLNCTVSEQSGQLEKELKKEILKKAAIYEKQNKDKNFKPYQGSGGKTTTSRE